MVLEKLFLDQKGGIEFAIYTLRKQYEKTEANPKLLIDAESPFNFLDWSLAFKNIANICSSILPAIQISYSHPSKLFVEKSFLIKRRNYTRRPTINGCVRASHFIFNKSSQR